MWGREVRDEPRGRRSTLGRKWKGHGSLQNLGFKAPHRITQSSSGGTGAVKRPLRAGPLVAAHPTVLPYRAPLMCRLEQRILRTKRSVLRDSEGAL
jgi:hypothetical protein